MKLLITGSRTGHAWVENMLCQYLVDCGDPDWLVLGDAEGVDRQALEFACDNDLFFVVHCADWEKHGKRAGPIRNAAMVASTGKGGRAMAFPMGKSPGTRGCAKLCAAAGIQTRVFELV